MITEFIFAYTLGLLSIFSPCTFIIVPVLASDINTKLKDVISFLGGVSITFSILGILAALTGKLLTNFMGPYLYLFAGLVTLISGLNILNVIELKLPIFNFKAKNYFLRGLLYGGVTLSCVGPLIAPVLVYIIAKSSVLFGFSMMGVFSLGFISPFLLFGLLITDKKISKRLAEYSVKIRKLGGIMLILVAAYLLFVAFRGML